MSLLYLNLSIYANQFYEIKSSPPEPEYAIEVFIRSFKTATA